MYLFPSIGSALLVLHVFYKRIVISAFLATMLSPEGLGDATTMTISTIPGESLVLAAS